MHLHSYLLSAVEILKLYNGEMPLAAWLKSYFKRYKKFGSRDRKQISDLCFCYYRLGRAFAGESVEERLLIAQFLCHPDSAFIKELKPDWAEACTLSFEKKLAFLNADQASFFPFINELSDVVNKNLFALSHLAQPDLFLRTRPGKKESVIKRLEEATISFTVEDDCLRLPNASKMDEVLSVDREVVVQDKSSQQVLNALKEHWEKASFSSWDCCAASGGKTILLHDYFPNAQLTVSDIRESILHNLRNRFLRAGVQKYQSFVADVSLPQFSFNKKFDVIICDAPCSGSGTWGRTPEQLTFFKPEKISYYSDLQKRIAANAVKQLKQGGAFVYITCSVFTEENEEVVKHLLQNSTLKPISQHYIKGYTEKADTLFTALFTL